MNRITILTYDYLIDQVKREIASCDDGLYQTNWGCLVGILFPPFAVVAVGMWIWLRIKKDRLMSKLKDLENKRFNERQKE